MFRLSRRAALIAVSAIALTACGAADSSNAQTPGSGDVALTDIALGADDDRLRVGPGRGAGGDGHDLAPLREGRLDRERPVWPQRDGLALDGQVGGDECLQVPCGQGWPHGVRAEAGKEVQGTCRTIRGDGMVQAGTRGQG